MAEKNRIIPLPTRATCVTHLLREHWPSGAVGACRILATCATGLNSICVFGYEVARSASEIDGIVRYLGTSAQTWRNDLQLHIAALNLKKAFDRVTTKLLRDAIVYSAIRTVLAAVVARTSGWQLASEFLRDRD